MSLSHPDNTLLWLLRGGAMLCAAVVLLILAFLANESWPILHHQAITHFFTDPSWHPTEGFYNLMPMLSATFFSTLGALLLAIPLGIASALFSCFYAPAWVAGSFRRLIELLAGIPSVVYGFWGLTTLAPLIAQWQPPGLSLFTAMLILALMILPTITLTADAALTSIPAALLRSGAALGFSRWGMISGIALPAARSGISAGIMLATGRAIGETMALLMVAGNVVQNPHSIFDPVRTLTANIALEMAFAMGDHRAALFVAGLLLMLLVLLLVYVSDLFIRVHPYA